METNAVDERVRFTHDFLTGQWSMTELCERYGVTRPTGYKWIARHRAGGAGALEERSRAPHRSPHRTEPGIEALVLAARRQYGWGAKKLLEEVGEGIWNIVYYRTLLGKIDERTLLITGV